MKSQPNHSIRCAARMLAMLAGMVFALGAGAQSFSIGTDLVSRYVWRGTDFGQSASLQPSLVFDSHRLEIGTWASYSISSDGADANEHDVWIALNFPAGSFGSVTAGVTDYYFPSPDAADFFDLSGNGEGSHMFEPFVAYAGPKTIPVTLFLAVFAHNDPDHSLYFEAGIPVRVDNVILELTAGSVLNRSAVYGTDEFSIVNLGFAVAKDLRISEAFAVPLTVSYVLNPHLERSFLVAGFSIGL
ncbi:MAG: hypothetical protein KJO98_14315 [Rhodothermia bacterium]|nr:hypothetical protein [Rhodothermia bacterium]